MFLLLAKVKWLWISMLTLGVPSNGKWWFLVQGVALPFRATSHWMRGLFWPFSPDIFPTIGGYGSVPIYGHQFAPQFEWSPWAWFKNWVCSKDLEIVYERRLSTGCRMQAVVAVGSPVYQSVFGVPTTSHVKIAVKIISLQFAGKTREYYQNHATRKDLLVE